MLKIIKRTIRELIKKTGWELVKSSVLTLNADDIPTNYPESYKDIFYKVQPYTMTTAQRIFAICNAIDYLVKHKIEGDIVGCGVWRGGVIMAGIETLQKSNDTGRQIYLYDTFEGMTTPSHHYDIKSGGNTGVGKTAEELYKNATTDDYVFCYSSLDEVKQNIGALNYPSERVHYIKGLVEDTIPTVLPEKISLLYFSIGFYKPVLHTLEHLYPRLVPGGVIVISDYGDWEGTKKAVDEFIENHKIPLLLNRIDNTGRIGVKI
jgi:O-methyltransferase